MSETKTTKKDDGKKEPKGMKEKESDSFFGTVVFIAFGLAFLVAVYAGARYWRGQADETPELPLASVMVEVNAFDLATRVEIAKLENEFKATGLFGSPLGPCDVKFLLPGPKPNDDPIAKTFTDMTDEEWGKAWPYVARTSWYVPRMFRLDGTACVIRLDAKNGTSEFAPGTASKLASICDEFRPKFKSLHVYSRPIGVGAPADKDAINASFGVQLCWIMIFEPSQGDPKNPFNWASAAGMSKLGRTKGVLSGNKHFRSIVTASNLQQYYWTVCLHGEQEVAVPQSDEQVQKALDFAKANGFATTYISADGKDAIVDTTTDVEGSENAGLFWYMASNLQDQLRIQPKSPWQPHDPKPLKGDYLPPDMPR
jgi:hypothetical protein